ncbi:hypothetical protein K504DRAFT_376168 [Pleomassaria siparia CBS 279.74]|uniref:Calcium channel subunit Mid1 n=1 Tax=Pleomassaria siparia CBS 279.74 TaxID=1314801 RepID=A0A6G1KEC3_9PLEO|nr:hypothetical protein K504DRAFT_376168 [Pleomassaria siparia CBS 279.74]
MLEEEEGLEETGYAPDFAYFDRSLIGRQTEPVIKLTNNGKGVADIAPGALKSFVFEKSQLKIRRGGDLDPHVGDNLSERNLEEVLEDEDEEGVDDEGREDVDGKPLKKRQSGQTVWISANTCKTASLKEGFIWTDTSPPPQLSLYISTRNQNPGPNSTNGVTQIEFEGGYANFSLNASSNIYIGVGAPELTKGWQGSWDFEVVASVDGQYHSYSNNTFLFMVDTDSDSALFITPNITSTNQSTEVDKWSNIDPFPFTMYTQKNDSWGPMTGMERSFCALQQVMDQNTNITVANKLTTRFAGNAFAKGQFHIKGLEAGTAYSAFLVVNGTAEGLDVPHVGVVPAGGIVWRQFSWITKPDDSCQVIFDLPFCTDVAYAVPSSAKYKNDLAGLISLYDDPARAYWTNFTNSLDQVACNTTGDAQYSLARNCDDCRHDYKTWLCSVLMPRCESFNATDDFLQERNIGAPFPNGTFAYGGNMTREFNMTRRDRLAYNQSRNPMIDTLIQPGPYKELLPCDYLCFDIVRSCPAQLGFSCPNEPAMRLTYGRKDDDRLTCSFPGAVRSLNLMQGGASSVVVGRLVDVLSALVVALAVAASLSI